MKHSEKPTSSNSVSGFEIVIFTNKGHVLKPISVKLFGIVIFVSEEHFENAFSPIEVTLSGIVIFVNEEHSEKA